jgi:hypothetical protein
MLTKVKYDSESNTRTHEGHENMERRQGLKKNYKSIITGLGPSREKVLLLQIGHRQSVYM